MKKAIILFLTFSLSYALTSFAQKSFEGKIVMRAENAATSEVSDITWYMKNGQNRLNYVNTNPKLNSSYSLVSSAGKLQMVNDGGSVDIDKSKLKNADFDFPDHKLLNKEGNKMVNEFNCIKYTLESGDRIAEVWMADDEDLSIADFPDFMQSNLLSICSNLQQGGIPIQILIKDKSNKLIYSQSITYIMVLKVDDAKFK